MPSHFIIHGGKPLSGTIAIQGSKNTALPLIAASLLTDEEVCLENIPDIADVEVMADIARGLGAKIQWEKSEHRLRIRGVITGADPDEALCRKLRGSILFSGALLARKRSVRIAYPGGDAIGSRPLTTHIEALRKLGVSVKQEEQMLFDGRGLAGTDLTLDEPSVTATENTILAALGAAGCTIIRLAACEPHVQELVAFLQAMGADIAWVSHGRVAVTGGGRPLHGARYRINPDELEVSSFAALAASTRSECVLEDVNSDYLDAVLSQLSAMGVAFAQDRERLVIKKPVRSYRNFHVQAGLYPKLGSDHLPPFAILATQAEGTSLIHDWLYENRLRYVPELQKMGANCTIADPHRVFITGPTPLKGCEIASPDIRSGMTLMVAGLVAEGRSVIAHAEHIDRGYERIDERLRELGADIQRVRSDK